MRMQTGFRFIDQQQRRPPIFGEIQERHQKKEPQRAVRRQIRPDYLVTETVFPMKKLAAVFVFENKILQVRKHPLNLPHDIAVQQRIIFPKGQQHRRQIGTVRPQAGGISDIPTFIDLRFGR